MLTYCFNSEKFEKLAAEQMQKIFARNKITRDFHLNGWTDRAYYTRHIIECVLRIRMNNELDNEAAQTEMVRNQLLAKDLTYYIYDELGHDDLFIADLEKLGVSRAQLDASRPFDCTLALMGYLRQAVKLDGALPAITWDWFLEYYGDRYNRTITNNAAAAFGLACTKGANAHLNTDEMEDHSGMMTRMMERAIKNSDMENRALNYLKYSIELVGEYFDALSAYAVAPTSGFSKLNSQRA